MFEIKHAIRHDQLSHPMMLHFNTLISKAVVDGFLQFEDQFLARFTKRWFEGNWMDYDIDIFIGRATMIIKILRIKFLAGQPSLHGLKMERWRPFFFYWSHLFDLSEEEYV